MKTNAVQTIKERLSMADVCEKYGLEADKKGFICCPFHSEKTPSMKIYKGDRGYYCFGCGEHGDVISFIQKMFHLDFQETLKKIDTDFGLNIYGEKTFEELRRSHYQQKVLKARKEREKSKKEVADREYWRIFDEWKRLDDNYQKYKPTSQDEQPHPLFIEAVQNLEKYAFLLEEAETERRK